MIAVLLIAFGSPDSIESIESFVANIMGGRKPSPEQLQKIKERYQKIGGYSPLLDITRKQAIALEKKLNTGEKKFKVFVGMRYWHPFIKDVLNEISDKKFEDVVSLVMSPHYSAVSTGGYIRAVNGARTELNININISFIKNWHIHPLFIEVLAEEIKKGLAFFDGIRASEIQVVFSAHSLPLRLMPDDDPYLKQLKETIDSVIKFAGNISWHLGFQSKGIGRGEWLEPSIDAILEKLSREGKRYVLLVPLSFVSDHIETLYDIDIIYKKLAESLGMTFHRTNSLNDSPKFIESLAGIIKGHLIIANAKNVVTDSARL